MIALVGTGNIDEGIAAVEQAADLDPDDEEIAASLQYLRETILVHGKLAR